MILAFLNTNPLQNFRVTQPKAPPKANHLLLLLPIISEQKAKGLGGGWKARWPRVIIHYLVSSSSNSSGAKITAEHDKGSRSSRVNMVAEHAISRALYLGSAAPHFPSNCSLCRLWRLRYTWRIFWNWILAPLSRGCAGHVDLSSALLLLCLRNSWYCSCSNCVHSILMILRPCT